MFFSVVKGYKVRQSSGPQISFFLFIFKYTKYIEIRIKIQYLTSHEKETITPHMPVNTDKLPTIVSGTSLSTSRWPELGGYLGN